jgi:hypothetical protein
MGTHGIPRGRLAFSSHLRSDQPVGENFVTFVSADGQEERSVSILDCFLDSAWRPLIEEPAAREGGLSGDIFHTNTLEYVTAERAGWTSLAREGDVLVSMRSNDLIGLLDPEAGRFTWLVSGSWRAQHQPSLLPGGRMLLFDNRGTPRRSRVLEFDPAKSEVYWDYQAAAEGEFYSNTCGSAQRLQNGNTLIVESSPGRAFEVDPATALVWEWRRPFCAGARLELIATLFDLVRLPAGFPVAWAEQGTGR